MPSLFFSYPDLYHKGKQEDNEHKFIDSQIIKRAKDDSDTLFRETRQVFFNKLQDKSLKNRTAIAQRRQDLYTENVREWRRRQKKTLACRRDHEAAFQQHVEEIHEGWKKRDESRNEKRRSMFNLLGNRQVLLGSQNPFRDTRATIGTTQ